MGNYNTAKRLYDEAVHIRIYGDRKEAESLFIRAIEALGHELATKEERELAGTIYEHLTEISLDLKNFDRALEFSKRALLESRALKDTRRIAQSYRLIAMVYSFLGRHEKKYYEDAMSYYFKALAAWADTKNYEMIGFTYFDLAFDAYKFGANYDYYTRYMLSAIIYLKKAAEEKELGEADERKLHLKLGKAYFFLSQHFKKRLAAGDKNTGVVLKGVLKKLSATREEESFKDTGLRKLPKSRQRNDEFKMSVSRSAQHEDIKSFVKEAEELLKDPQKAVFLLKYVAFLELKIYVEKTGEKPEELFRICEFFRKHKSQALEYFGDSRVLDEVRQMCEKL